MQREKLPWHPEQKRFAGLASPAGANGERVCSTVFQAPGTEHELSCLHVKRGMNLLWLEDAVREGQRHGDGMRAFRSGSTGPWAVDLGLWPFTGEDFECSARERRFPALCCRRRAAMAGQSDRIWRNMAPTMRWKEGNREIWLLTSAVNTVTRAVEGFGEAFMMLENQGENAACGKNCWIRSVGPAAIALITGIFITCGFAAQAQDYRLDDIVIEGAVRVEPGTVLSYAGLSEGAVVTVGELNAAYQNVVESQLFETVEFEPQGNTLLIRVQEHPTINSISFEGNSRITDGVLEPIVQSKTRDFLNPGIVEEDAARITQAYQQAGRLGAGVDPVIIRRSDNRVDLVFEIREGRVSEVERISFVGNRSFSDRRLRGALESKQAGLLRQFVQRDTFVADRIELDKQILRDFYTSRGFVDFEILSATVEFSRERDAFFVMFSLREGQRFRYGDITATSDLADIDVDEFQSAIRIKPGQFLLTCRR